MILWSRWRNVMNNNTLFSILLVALGLLVGFIIAFVINSLKVSKATKKAENLIAQAKKDIEKLKRDAAIEHQLHFRFNIIGSPQCNGGNLWLCIRDNSDLLFTAYCVTTRVGSRDHYIKRTCL